MSSYTIDRVKWTKMSIFDQMGNISSEVGRSFNAKRKHQELECSQAISRAIDLFDATIEVLLAIKSPKLREVLRAKESYLNAIYSKELQTKNIDSLEKYFTQYSLAARLGH